MMGTRFLAGVVLALLGLVGCGGGGAPEPAASAPSAGGLPAAPVVSVSASTKQLNFSWGPASGATSYRLMSNPHGVSGFTQVGSDLPASTTSVSTAVSVHTFDWDNARFIIAACNSIGCTNSAPINPSSQMLDAIGYVKASNPDRGDKFGNVVALSGDGDTLAIQALQEDSGATGINGDETDNLKSGAGAVYVFVRSAGHWVQQAYVKASNTRELNYFGSGIALNFDGSVMVVGAPNESGSSPGVNGDQDQTAAAAPDSGAAYVFRRIGQSWSQQAYIKASHVKGSTLTPLRGGAVFGSSVAIDAVGDTIAVGAYGEDSSSPGINGDELDAGAEGAGAVYVFSNAGSTWQQQAYVKASNPQSQDMFGFSITLSGDGNTLAVSSMFEDSASSGVNSDQLNDNLTDSGAVYVFTRSGNNWSQQAYIKASNPGQDDRFGFSLSLTDDGNTLAVGALNEESDAVGINGDQANNDATGCGAVYLFHRSGSSWAQTAYVKPSISYYMNFGNQVALSADGTMLAVAAREEGGASIGIDGDQSNVTIGARDGAVYIFRQSTGVWSQASYVKASNTQDDDTFGWSLALSADGSVMAVGARDEDSRSSGINGDQENDVSTTDEFGAVYLY